MSCGIYHVVLGIFLFYMYSAHCSTLCFCILVGYKSYFGSHFWKSWFGSHFTFSLPFTLTFIILCSLSFKYYLFFFIYFDNLGWCLFPPLVSVWWQSLFLFPSSWLLLCLLSLFLLPLLFLVSVLFFIYSVLIFHGFLSSPHWRDLVICLFCSSMGSFLLLIGENCLFVCFSSPSLVFLSLYCCCTRLSSPIS